MLDVAINFFLFAANGYLAMQPDSTWPRLNAFASGLCLFGLVSSLEKLAGA